MERRVSFFRSCWGLWPWIPDRPCCSTSVALIFSIVTKLLALRSHYLNEGDTILSLHSLVSFLVKLSSFFFLKNLCSKKNTWGEIWCALSCRWRWKQCMHSFHLHDRFSLVLLCILIFYYILWPRKLQTILL